MARQQINIDSQANWETGEFRGTNALDPAGSITLGVDSAQIATYVSEGGLAVYCRCYEGSGSTATNVGLAGNATLASHAWVERADGRSWLSGGNATVTYHASMRVADDNGKFYRQSGGIRIKLAAVTTQVLMTRANEFILGINGDGKPYITGYVPGLQTSTSGDALEADTEYAISFTAVNGTLSLYVNGVLKSSYSGTKGKTVNNSTNLVVSCSGYWTDFYLFGDGTAGVAIDRQASGGTWSKIIDLGEVQKLHHLYVNCAKIEAEHSISATVSFGSTEDEIEYERNDNSINWTVLDGENWLEPPETKLRYGQYVKIQINLGTMDWSRDLPLIYEMEGDFMPLAGALLTAIDTKDSTYSELEGDVDPTTTPENLESAIEAIRELQAIVRSELGRPYRSSGGSGNLAATFRIASLTAERDLLANRLTTLEAAVGLFDAGTFQIEETMLYGRTQNEADSILLGMVMQDRDKHGALDAKLSAHIDDTYSGNVHNLGTDLPSAWGGSIATHAALTTGVHGAGEGNYVCLVSYLTAHAGATNVHVPEGEEVEYKSNATAKVTAHAENASAHHSRYTDAEVENVIDDELLNGQSIDNRIDTLIAAHNVASPAHSADGSIMGFYDVVYAVATHDSASTAHTGTGKAITAHEGRCVNYATS